MHVVQVRGGLAQEGRVQEFGDIGQGQHAAHQGKQGQEGLPGLHQGMVDQPLGGEAAGGRHAHHGQARDGEHAEGEGHLAADAAQIIQAVPVRGEHHSPADQEEQVFEEDVVDQVQHAARVAQGPARGHGQHHVAQLAHGGVDEDQLDAVGPQGLHGGHDDGDAADPHDDQADHALFEAVQDARQGKTPAQQHEELDQADDGALQQHRGYVAGHRRGGQGRVHLPVNAEGQLGGLHHKAHGQQGHAQPGRARGQVGHKPGQQAGVEGREGPEHAEAHKEEARAQKVEEKVLEGFP